MLLPSVRLKTMLTCACLFVYSCWHVQCANHAISSTVRGLTLAVHYAICYAAVVVVVIVGVVVVVYQSTQYPRWMFLSVVLFSCDLQQTGCSTSCSPSILGGTYVVHLDVIRIGGGNGLNFLHLTVAALRVDVCTTGIPWVDRAGGAVIRSVSKRAAYQ